MSFVRKTISVSRKVGRIIRARLSCKRSNVNTVVDPCLIDASATTVATTTTLAALASAATTTITTATPVTASTDVNSTTTVADATSTATTVINLADIALANANNAATTDAADVASVDSASIAATNVTNTTTDTDALAIVTTTFFAVTVLLFAAALAPTTTITNTPATTTVVGSPPSASAASSASGQKFNDIQHKALSFLPSLVNKYSSPDKVVTSTTLIPMRMWRSAITIPPSATLDELVYYASLHPLDRNIGLSAADGMWFSDTLIDAETTDDLKNYADILESVPDRLKDYHPNDRSRALHLIDPSLFPLIYSRSKLCHHASISPQIFLGLENALSVTEDGESDYYLPTGDRQYVSYSSDINSWLPSEFRIGDNGFVTIQSYINNLHPVKHAAFYPTIARVFSKFLPLLEQVVTDLVHPRQPRVKPDSSKYYKSDEPLPDDDDEDRYEKLILWKSRATFVPPQPESFVAPARPVNPYNLCGRRLQAIVKMANIELTSERPNYGGKDWSVLGLANERIIATGIFFYDVANVAPSSLQFREAICCYYLEVDLYDVDSVVRAYGIERSRLGREEPASQGLGSVGIEDGRCVVFPNIHQYKLLELKLADKTKPGHCKMLTFYFVDPNTHIPSTEIVPPQQQDWYFEATLASEPFRSLPQLVVDGVIAKVDFPISLKEAKKSRLHIHEDESRKGFISDLYEPRILFSSWSCIL
ncbi:hypothetical protein GGI17_006251 [Coemansia sp. S146]|nr:hypothetical protein GGI17_006251 [Coemansia sp. S146]